METNVPNTDGAGEDLLLYLERLWRIPARAPAHDPPRNGWLICVCVFALIACGCALGALATASVVPLLVAAASCVASGAVAVRHQHVRNRRRSRWH